jgi:iron complex transport system substrate-binding protein
VTQAVCEVCAVSYDDVVAVSAALPSRPRVLSLDPLTLDDVLGDILRVADAAGDPAAGERTHALARQRLTAIARGLRDAPRPRVAAIEWLDPPFAAGHWVPEMVSLAGGIDPLGVAGEKSRTVSWDELAAARPEIVVVMPCGYDEARAADEAEAFSNRLEALGADRVVAVNASAYFSRPGPRLIEGVELLAGLLHPELVGAGGGT